MRDCFPTMVEGECSRVASGVRDAHYPSPVLISRVFDDVERIRFAMFAGPLELSSRKPYWTINKSLSHGFHLNLSNWLAVGPGLEQVVAVITRLCFLQFGLTLADQVDGAGLQLHSFTCP